ncbi:MAG: tRNA (N(6)-L-threonylcarbamoyladenosine(37)-C(2))-methylthiotransferase MtaB [Candidatus Gastranaerophilales bacterium]|nr:tRNA (N(6)-L-threonylcarbamoyladenosine(37)-C(2))-methylthiotransferase MtaB [Candidatus Gastranaerophilales bacterium]
MNRNFILKSMGCKSNQFEGSLLIERLVEAGFTQVKDYQSADYFILNSCSVTHKSDNEALYLLRNALNINPNIKNIITGCVAQIEKDKLLELPYIHYVFGNDDKFDIVNLLNSNTNNAVSDIMTLDSFNYQILNDTTKTRLSLKIQDGCNNRCAYCIIPFARGKSRSADSEFIIEQINNASKNGFKEVVFTGIHIGQWGIENDKTILDLLKDVENKTTIERYRLGSLNPLEITSELLDFLENSEKFCPHFHLSLQSACNKTLQSMNRFYTVEKYLEQIEDIVSRFDRPFLGSDIIAGFVGETEEDFLITVENLKKSKLSKIHTFPYSIRQGTQAEQMSGHNSDKIKQQRADIIKRISNEKFDEFMSKNLNSTQEILIEKRPDKHTGKLKGVTRNYINVIIDNEPNNKENYYNTIQKVKLTKIMNDKFYTELLQ